MNEAIARILGYLRARLSEPSTYPAVVLVLSAVGMKLAPEQKEAVMIGGMFLAGLIGAALPDRIGKNTRVGDDPDKTLPPVTQPKGDIK